MLNPAQQGWIGTAGELYSTLRSFKCDRTADGRFCVDGSIVSYMGMGEEMCVGPDAVYYVDGQPKNLCHALGMTSYGMGVTVIS